MDKKIIKGALSLLMIQGANFLLPFTTFPYLLRVLGAQEFGRLAFGQATIAYFVLLTDYGFNFSGTQQIAQVARDPLALSKVYWEVTCAKLCLAVVSLLTLVALTSFFPMFAYYKETIIASFPLVIGSVLFPQWLFQGMEKLGFISMCNITARLATIPATFLLVHDKEHVWLAALINASGSVLAGIIAIGLIVRFRLVTFILPTWKDIFRCLEDGWHVFVSTASISLYTTTNTVMLGVLTNPAMVGFFASADKIRGAAQQCLISPLSNAVFPRVAVLMKTDRSAAFSLLRRLLIFLGGGTFIVSIVLSVFAPEIVKLAMGAGYSDSVLFLRIQAWLIFLIGLSNVYGVQVMLNVGMKKTFSKILLLSGALNLCLLVLLVKIFGGVGASLAVLTTEITVTVAMYISLRSKGISIMKSGIKNEV